MRRVPLWMAWVLLVGAAVLAPARVVESQATLSHKKISIIPDGTNPNQIQSSDWNDTHRFSGGSHGSLLLRDTGQADGANWLAGVATGQVLVSQGIGVLPAYAAIPTLTAVRLGATPAESGAIRFSHGDSLVARNSANTADEAIVSFGVVATNDTVLGGTSGTTRLRSSLAAPTALADGHWWVECTGASPARECAIKVRDQGVTRTIAWVTF